MNVKKALKNFQEFEPVIVSGTTFTAEHLEEIKLETGEVVYWIRDGGDLWLLLDPQSEEIILFHDIEEEVDASSDTLTFGGEDYDLEYEAKVHILDDGEETDEVIIRDFSGPDGELLRVMENMVTNEVTTSQGRTVTEDELQEV